MVPWAICTGVLGCPRGCGSTRGEDTSSVPAFPPPAEGHLGPGARKMAGSGAGRPSDGESPSTVTGWMVRAGPRGCWPRRVRKDRSSSQARAMRSRRQPSRRFVVTPILLDNPEASSAWGCRSPRHGFQRGLAAPPPTVVRPASGRRKGGVRKGGAARRFGAGWPRVRCAAGIRTARRRNRRMVARQSDGLERCHQPSRQRNYSPVIARCCNSGTKLHV